MKLFIISRKDIDPWAYDVFNSFIVAAETEEIALNTDPRGFDVSNRERTSREEWVADVTCLTAKYIGEAAPDVESGILHAAYVNS